MNSKTAKNRTSAAIWRLGAMWQDVSWRRSQKSWNNKRLADYSINSKCSVDYGSESCTWHYQLMDGWRSRTLSGGHQPRAGLLSVLMRQRKMSTAIQCSITHGIIKQEAQLPQRDSASATHVFLGQLTAWSCTSLSTASVLQLYNRLAELVSTLSANKPCDIRTLSWIGHSRSFKDILIGPGRNPEWSVVVMCN